MQETADKLLTDEGRTALAERASWLTNECSGGEPSIDLTASERAWYDDAKSDGFNIRGVGSGRVVTTLPEAFLADDRRSAGNFVLKFARPRNDHGENGTDQTQAEQAIWNAADAGRLPSIDSGHLAKVYDGDDSGEWLLMEYLPPLTEAYDVSPSILSELERAIEVEFINTPFNPDLAAENIGVRAWSPADAPPIGNTPQRAEGNLFGEQGGVEWLSFIDYGVDNWRELVSA